MLEARCAGKLFPPALLIQKQDVVIVGMKLGKSGDKLSRVRLRPTDDPRQQVEEVQSDSQRAPYVGGTTEEVPVCAKNGLRFAGRAGLGEAPRQVRGVSAVRHFEGGAGAYDRLRRNRLRPITQVKRAVFMSS